MRVFGWRRYRIEPAEVARGAKDLAVARSLETRALAIRGEASRVGDSLRILREKNHFGETITHAVRKA